MKPQCELSLGVMFRGRDISPAVKGMLEVERDSDDLSFVCLYFSVVHLKTDVEHSRVISSASEAF